MYKKLDVIERAILLNPKYIKIFRNKLNITQSKLAEESGVSQSHLSMLEKGKRKATKSHAAAITLGLLKCSDIWDKEDPIDYLLDVLSLTKLESTVVKFVKEITEGDSRYKRFIQGYPVFVIDRDSLQDYLRRNIKVISIGDVEFLRGRMVVEGIYADNREVTISLDYRDIERLEVKISETIGKNVVIQIFPREKMPPIYGLEDDGMIINCW
ncbi:MAG TPA: XRE family transcriptional regulator [Methanothermococcus okinawensis]|uniref:XRE family transcriptional regulator n=1 Tax=Methanothermococcus okinawensis TaxID=155863 RepID=A0A832ZAV3_9EURY|nr:XRE family transcriptional regulator [Methanococcaceae archaeon]HIP84223.1 XRE family transcriptional regulator [Methanothermococcus okinawensis]HIP91021.1 XRE family transcriptional regulator [Methanothermococcus okinawensis]